MSFWAIIDPESGTNLVCNPSAETTGNYAPIGAAVTQSTDQARHGIRAWKVVTAGTSQGLFLFCTTATNTTHYASAYIRGTVTGTISFSANSGTNKNAASVIGGHAAGFVRYGVALPPAQTSNSPYLSIFDSANDGTLYIDAVQFEPNAGYPTTYIDGDREGLYHWNGLRHGSSSDRDAQERSGGVERDLDTYYGIRVRPTFQGVGMPPIQNNFQQMALQPGALLQSQKVMPRELQLDLLVNNITTSTTWQNLHRNRQSFINLVKPDRARGAQPFTLRYTGDDAGAGASPLYAKFVYADGLGFNGNNLVGFHEQPPVKLVAPDPFWYEDNQEQVNLAFQQNISNTAFAAARINGQWRALGSGPNNSVYCVRVDEKRGRVWYAGAFTTANGVACNRIGYWTGSTFKSVGGASVGTTGGSGIIQSMTLMPNGDNWIFGDFTTAGGTVTRGIARWNNDTDTFTCFNLTTNSYNWDGGAVDTNGNLYAFGRFLQWNSVTTQSYITYYDSAAGTWSAIAGHSFSATEIPYTGIFDKKNDLLIGSAGFAPGAGHLRKLSGTTWTDLGATEVGSKQLYNINIRTDNSYLISGNWATIAGAAIPYLAIYNGNAFVSPGTVNQIIFDLAVDSQGLYAIMGNNVYSLKLWNGSTFVNVDTILPVSGNIVGRYYKNDLYLGLTGSTSTGTNAAGITNIVPGQTVSVYPKVTLVGPTTAGTTASLVWLENQSSQERLYFSQTVQGGETVTLDCATGKKTVVSDWLGTIYGQPLSGSDAASFHLLPTTNTIACFISGQATSTSGTAAIMQWTPAHYSVDGGA